MLEPTLYQPTFLHLAVGCFVRAQKHFFSSLVLRIAETEAIEVHSYDWLVERLRGAVDHEGPPASNPHVFSKLSPATARSNYQSTINILFSPKPKPRKTIERLKALKTAQNELELAEYDLQLRGSGELYVGKAWGISDLAMEAINTTEMLEPPEPTPQHSALN